jgi:hypothetical protein
MMHVVTYAKQNKVLPMPQKYFCFPNGRVHSTTRKEKDLKYYSMSAFVFVVWNVCWIVFTLVNALAVLEPHSMVRNRKIHTNDFGKILAYWYRAATYSTANSFKTLEEHARTIMKDNTTTSTTRTAIDHRHQILLPLAVESDGSDKLGSSWERP